MTKIPLESFKNVLPILCKRALPLSPASFNMLCSCTNKVSTRKHFKQPTFMLMSYYIALSYSLRWFTQLWDSLRNAMSRDASPENFPRLTRSTPLPCSIYAKVASTFSNSIVLWSFQTFFEVQRERERRGNLGMRDHRVYGAGRKRAKIVAFWGSRALPKEPILPWFIILRYEMNSWITRAANMWHPSTL